jgi:hypothetical protein
MSIIPAAMSSYNQLSPEQLMHISLAALDFINSKRQAPKSKHIGTVHWQNFHEQKKQRIRKFYEAGKTDSLQRAWKKILEEEVCQWYPDFDAFVKEQTGYAINTQGELKERVSLVISRGYIRDNKEHWDVMMLSGLESKLGNTDKAEQLKKLLQQYQVKHPSQKIAYNEKPAYKATLPDSFPFDQFSTEKMKKIILAAIDFAEDRRMPRVTRNNEPNEMNLRYERFRERAEKCDQAGKAVHLRRLFRELLEEECLLYFHEFDAYIHEKTGYAINTQDGLRAQVSPVLERGYIRNGKEYENVSALYVVEYGMKNMPMAEKLRELIQQYQAGQPSPEIPYYSKNILAVFSPDNTCCARTHEGGPDEDSADTSIDVSFSNGGIPVGGAGFCTIYGTDIDLQLLWKDDHTLMVIHPGDAIFNSQWTDVNFGERALKIIYTAR